MALIENLTTLWRYSTQRLCLKRSEVAKMAFLAGAIGGLTALIFYRALLPWWLREKKITEIPGMVGQAMADTENPQVLCGLLAGASGGVLISFASSSVPRSRVRHRLVDMFVFLLGGVTLAVAQQVVGGERFHPYWPEFLAYGGAATLACTRLVRFASLRGMADVILLTFVPAVVGAIAFGLVNVTLGRIPLHRGDEPAGFNGWLIATTVTCPLYLTTLSALTYLFARAKYDASEHAN